MMKLYILVIFMSSMLKFNKMVMYCHNFCYLLSFNMLFFYTGGLMSGLNWVKVSLNLGVDKYSYFLVILVFWIIGAMYMTLMKEEYEYNFSLFIMMMIIVMSSFIELNLMMFYLFFEVSLIPIFVMIIMWGYNYERVSASMYMLMYMMLISFLLLTYIMYMYNNSGSLEFNMLVWGKSMNLNLWSYMIVFLVFYIKLPMFMFHIWLPKAHVEASVYGSMILAAVLLKLGAYGMIRMSYVYLSEVSKFNYIFVSIGLMGSVMVSILSLVQADMKMLIAYFSIIHMNVLMSSLMTVMSLGVVGSYFMMIMHGLCSSGLFYMVGVIFSRSFSRLMIINKGILGIVSGLSLLWFYLCMVNFSFPFSVSFFSEIFMLSVMLEWALFLIFILMMICFFSSAGSLYLFAYIFHGKMNLMDKIGFIEFKEFMVLIIHSFPIFMFIMNLIF